MLSGPKSTSISRTRGHSTMSGACRAVSIVIAKDQSQTRHPGLDALVGQEDADETELALAIGDLRRTHHPDEPIARRP